MVEPFPHKQLEFQLDASWIRLGFHQESSPSVANANPALSRKYKAQPAGSIKAFAKLKKKKNRSSQWLTVV